MTLTEQVTWVVDATNRRRAGQAGITQARVAAKEAATADHHELRADLALAVLTEPEVWELRFARAVVADPALTTTTPTDAQLVTAAAVAFNELAGAPGPA